MFILLAEQHESGSHGVKQFSPNLIMQKLERFTKRLYVLDQLQDMHYYLYLLLLRSIFIHPTFPGLGTD